LAGDEVGDETGCQDDRKDLDDVLRRHACDSARARGRLREGSPSLTMPAWPSTSSCRRSSSS
jgi:hypothetical protein